MRLLLVAVVLLSACRRDSPQSDYDKALSWFRADRYDLALPLADRGLQRAGQAGDQKLAWRFRLLKAEMLLSRRRVPEGLALLQAGPPAGPAWQEERGRTFLLQGFGAYLRNQLDASERLLLQAADTARQAGSPALAAEVDLRFAMLLVRQRKFAEAESKLLAVTEAVARMGDPYLEARAAGNMGFVLLNASRYDDAIVWSDRASGLFGTLGAAESVARSAGNAGACYLRLGDYDNARLRFEQAEKEASRAGNRFDQQVWIGNRANVAFEQGDYAAAAAQYQRALEIARDLPDKTWAERWSGNLADALIYMGNFTAAETYNNQALELSRGLPAGGSEPYCLYNAARIAAARNDLRESERLLVRALGLPAEDPTILLDTRRELAGLYVQSGRDGKADAEFRAAIAEVDRTSAGIVQDEHRLSYLDGLIRFYGAYIDFLMSRNQSERALEVAESSRSKVLAQRSGRPESGRPQTAAAFQRLSAGADATVLEYWVGRSRSYMWVVTGQGIRHYELPPAAELRALVDTYQKAVLARENPLESAAGAGRKLRDLLIAPALKDGREAGRYLLVPDKFLYSLNFETLPGQHDDRFWIEQATMAIAPSLNYLIESGAPVETAGRTALLLVGDSVATLPQYPKLDYAGREIDRIGTLLTGSTQRILRGADARPDAYAQAQPGNFDFIHFSAHAEANPLSPLSSAVILSGPPGRCRLFARDVAAIPLRAKLVAISACHAVGARTYSGEGPVGFAWAFLKAGAHNVIAGLWDVNDRSTAMLMGQLYARIAGRASMAEALREAKLALVRGGGSYARPYYWAPFELYTRERR